MRTAPLTDFDPSHLAQNSPYYWHQGWDLFPGLSTTGRSPVDALMDAASAPKRMDGLRVADIGAWNGCLALECERRGAKEVVAITLEDPEQVGFNYLRKAVGAERTTFERGSIYNLDPDKFGLFDLVICFGVIYHLRYPVLGLDNLRRIARNELYLESQVLDQAYVDLANDNNLLTLAELSPCLPAGALMQFYKGAELADEASNWFSPSMSAVTGILESSGFTVESQKVSGQRGYWKASVNAGLPPFIDRVEGHETYEGLFYDLSFNHLFGDREKWRR